VALALALDLNQTRPAALKQLILIDSIAYRQRLPLFIRLLQAPVLAQIGIYAVLPEIESYEGLYAAYHDPVKSPSTRSVHMRCRCTGREVAMRFSRPPRKSSQPISRR
jgi:hypothetical protein